MNEISAILAKREIDIFTLSETWLHEGIENTILAIEGYDLYRVDRDRVGWAVKEEADRQSISILPVL